ncbi:site-specific integrase [Alistipes sp. OttesenSCG-928-L06]|nr:site-specific integrase [Alistipes sp. OttesenSCG-928-L06]
MKPTFTTLFYIKRDKLDSAGTAPIFLKLTVNGGKAEHSMKRRIDPEKWSNGRAIGTSGVAKEINKDIESLQSRLLEIRREMIENGIPVTAKHVINILNGGDIHNQKSFMEIIRSHNHMVLKLLGIDYAPATLKRYETTADHIERYIRFQYKKGDILLSELNYEFIAGLEQYLKIERKCNHNSTMKYIKNVKTFVHHAIKNEWLLRDPFVNFKCKFETTIRECLTEEEIQRMLSKPITNERLNIIRDIFLFSVFTGLAHVDISSLKMEHIIEHKGKKLIRLNRTKTGVPSYIYLLPVALSLLDKYNDHPLREDRGTVFPVPSNQKTNAYLKELADICGIEKNLTFHMARHSFGTTISMGNNISTEATGHSLGQKQLKTTQHYARVEIEKVINEYSKIEHKYEI